MDTMSAFAMGEANRNNPTRVFDWVRAARRIREEGPTVAGAGLSGDLDWTGGDIYTAADGIVDEDDTYTFLESTWAIPVLLLDGDEEPCWRWSADTPGWGAKTYWPDEARLLLGGGD